MKAAPKKSTRKKATSHSTQKSNNQKTGLRQKAKDFWNWGDPSKVLVVGLVLVGGFFAVKYSYIAYYRIKYDRIGDDLMATLEDIKKEASVPSKWELNKTCRYASAKFTTGDLGCGVYLKLVYSATSDEMANDLVPKIVSAIDHKNIFRRTAFSQQHEITPFGTVEYNSPNAIDGLDYEFRGHSRPRCGLGVEKSWDHSRDGEQGLTVIVGCGQSPLRFPFYPVAED